MPKQSAITFTKFSRVCQNRVKDRFQNYFRCKATPKNKFNAHSLCTGKNCPCLKEKSKMPVDKHCPKCGFQLELGSTGSRVIECEECGYSEPLETTTPHSVPPANQSELLWRELLWLHHGCSDGIYGDDGEMQCNNTLSHFPIDFKRDSEAEISKKLRGF